MKTLPSIPKSIPSRILEQVKAKGLVYVGEGVGGKSPIFGEKGEDSHYCVSGEFAAGLQYGGTMKRHPNPLPDFPTRPREGLSFLAH